MEYFLGMDGGATSTTCAVCTDEGVVLGVGHAGPSNHILAPGGRDRAHAAVSASVHGALAAAGLGTVEFRAARFGMTGITAGTDAARALEEVIRGVLTAGTIAIDSDAVVARAGALAGRPGVVVIAGTGSVAFGEDPGGRQARAGGWGYLFGDEGSGFALGLAGVRAALHAQDGTGPATALTARIPDAAGCRLGEIPFAFYEGRLTRDRIAALARCVTASADAGDAVAQRLVQDAVDGLAALVTAVIHKLSWPDGAVAVAPVGGVFAAGPTLLRPLARAISARAAGAVLVPPRFAPAVGALLLALRDAEIRLTPIRLALLVATWEVRTAAPPPPPAPAQHTDRAGESMV
jgi:N-acetylglucosamine kinase-like BadF-type ATPase